VVRDRVAGRTGAIALDRSIALTRFEEAGSDPIPSIAEREGKRLVRALRIFGVTLIALTYFITAPLGYGVFGLWALVPSRDPDRRARRLQRIMTIAFRSMHALLRWLRILDFDPKHMDGKIPSTACVLVSNHPTLTDISALLAAEGNLVFPVKPALFRSFWARPLLDQAQHFAGSGPGVLDVGAFVDDAIDRLRRGYRLMIFPEGTRSPRQGMHPFGRSAFEIACRAGVPIIPLVITSTPRWLWKECSFLDPPDELTRLRIRVLPAVWPSAAGSSSRALRDIVYMQIESELRKASPS
jgi:1-acyl-sn-glycerol-3-phosphate acyltransferase